jgi:hypothetical protein
MQALLNTGADEITIYRMMTTDGGTNWFGEVIDFQIPDQTPWTQNIDGATFTLRNTGFVAINTPNVSVNKSLLVGINTGGGEGVRFDNPFGRFDFINGSGAASTFLPTIRGLNDQGSPTEPGVILDGVINSTADTGTTIPIIKLRGFANVSSPIDIVNRPMVQIVNGFPETLLWSIFPNGNVIQTGSLDMDGQAIILDPGGDSQIQAGTNNVMQFTVDSNVTLSISPASSIFTNDVTAPNLNLTLTGIPAATFENTTSTPPNFTALGNISFEGEDSIGTDIQYSLIQGRAEVTSSGNRQGGIVFWVNRGSTSVNTAMMVMNNGGSGSIRFNSPIQLPEITLPANPAANTGLIYSRDVSGVTTPFFLDSAGTETGILQTPWAQAIDAATNNLTNLGRIELADSTVGATNIAYIVHDGINMRFNVQTGDGMLWTVNAASIMGLGVSQINAFQELDMNTNKVINVVDPTNPQDAATKNYVDTTREGFQDYSIWITHETSQFDFEVFMSNTKTGGEPVSGSLIEDGLVYVPFWLGERARLSEMGFELNTAPGGTFTVAMGIYTNRTDGQNYPQTKLDDNNQVFSGAGAHGS